MIRSYTVVEHVWLYGGKASWHFLSIPIDISRDIDFYCSQQKRGWGSLKVTATIRKTTWSTSLFPDKKTQHYLLPIKSSVRVAEKIKANDTITVFLELSC